MAAETLADAAAHARYLPADLCCDRFVCTVIARYADGSSKTVTAAIDSNVLTSVPLAVTVTL